MKSKETLSLLQGKLVKLKIGGKIILTLNIDIQDRLINSKTRYISHTEFGQDGAHKKNCWVPTEISETEL